MTLSEKSGLYNFLTTAQGWITGYRSPVSETPENKHSPVMIIGDVSGRTGELLDKMLGAINLSRTENCYLAQLMESSDRANLETEIAIIKPLIILSLGKTTAQNLLKTAEDIKNLRGRIINYNGIPLMATYHPEDLLLDETLKRPVWEDLKLFRAELDRLLAG